MRHKTEIVENGKPKLQLINNCSRICDRFFFVLLFPDGGKRWHYQMNCKSGSENLTLKKQQIYIVREEIEYECDHTRS